MAGKPKSGKPTAKSRSVEVPSKAPIYVPILKWKRGEVRALQELDPNVAAVVRPLIEIIPVPWDYKTQQRKETVDTHLADVADNIEQCWGNRPIMVDLGLLDSDDMAANNQHPLSVVFADARARGLHTIPVTGPDRDDPYQNAVADVIRADGNGVCVRIASDDLTEDHLTITLNTLLTRLSVSPSQVDLVLDLEAIDQGSQRPWTATAQSVLQQLPHATDWRSLTIAATSFPTTLSNFQPGAIGWIPRVEWSLWLSLAGRTLPRKPMFGDYAIAAPVMTDLDPRIMHISAAIRYTIAMEWLIFRGRDLRDTRFPGHAQYRTLSQQLVSNSSYSGATFSWGDKYASDCATGIEGHGNPEVWRKVGTNHHITLVVRQLTVASQSPANPSGT